MDALLVFFADGFDGLIRDVEELDQSLSAPMDLFVLGVDDDCVAPSDVVAEEGLL